MVSQDFLHTIGLKDDADISVAATRFVECVKEYINFVEKSPSEENVAKEEREIKALYKSFFPYSIAWAQRERQKTDEQENHPQALELKDKAQAAIDDLQNNLIDFALCDMSISRSLGFINAEIMREPESKKSKIKWTGDTGILLRKQRKRRKDLEAANELLVKAITLLDDINPKRAAVENAAAQLFGQDVAEKLLASYRSGLRMGDFKKARKWLSKALSENKKFTLDKKKNKQLETTMKKNGEAYIAFIEKHRKALRGSNTEKLFLKSGEINLALEANNREIEQSEAFIKKYFRPYLSYQIKSLKFLRTKLLVVGSLESLMTLYIRMMRGIAEPLADIKAVRLYESEVIEHVMYLLGGQFQEMKNINAQIEEILQEFRTSVHDYEAVKD